MTGATGTTGVTVVSCGTAGCPHAAAAPAGADDALRAAVRACPHGMLVRAGCLHGGCGATTGSAGPHLVVQPCAGDTGRRPAGPGLVVGPLHEQSDVDELCGWLRAGAPAPAPAHLVAGVLAPRTVRRPG